MSRRGPTISGLSPAAQRQALDRYRAELERTKATPAAAELDEAPARRRGKYDAQRVVVDGEHFDSKLEARFYAKLKALRGLGLVSWFVRQVPFVVAVDADGNAVRYRADFLIVWSDGRVEVADTKGYDTQTSRVKRAAVEERYGLRIEVYTRERVDGCLRVGN